jgi:hypothetical protein
VGGCVEVGVCVGGGVGLCVWVCVCGCGGGLILCNAGTS